MAFNCELCNTAGQLYLVELGDDLDAVELCKRCLDKYAAPELREAAIPIVQNKPFYLLGKTGNQMTQVWALNAEQAKEEGLAKLNRPGRTAILDSWAAGGYELEEG